MTRTAFHLVAISKTCFEALIQRFNFKILKSNVNSLFNKSTPSFCKNRTSQSDTGLKILAQDFGRFLACRRAAQMGYIHAIACTIKNPPIKAGIDNGETLRKTIIKPTITITNLPIIPLYIAPRICFEAVAPARRNACQAK
jgi:hypothetical protein